MYCSSLLSWSVTHTNITPLDREDTVTNNSFGIYYFEPTIVNETITYRIGDAWEPQEGDTTNTLGFPIYLSDFNPNAGISIYASIDFKLSGGNGKLIRPGSYEWRLSFLNESDQYEILEYAVYDSSFQPTGEYKDTVTTTVPNPVVGFPAIGGTTSITNDDLNQEVQLTGNPTGTITLQKPKSLVNQSVFYSQGGSLALGTANPISQGSGARWKLELMSYTP